jgi:WD40 repeat protein
MLKKKGLSDICWTKDSRYIATVSDDMTAILWDANDVCQFNVYVFQFDCFLRDN